MDYEEEELRDDIARWLEGFRNRFESALYEFSLHHISLASPLILPGETPLFAGVKEMMRRRSGCILVGDEGRLQGIFTERDLVTKVIPHRLDLDRIPLHAVMTPHPRFLKKNARLVHALHLMAVGDFRHIPVLDENSRVVGIVSVKEIIKFLVELFPDEILNIPPEEEKSPGEEGGG